MEKGKPVIGIVTKPLSDFECPEDIWTEDYVKEEFRELVCGNGGLAIGVLPQFHTGKYNPDESRRVFEDNLTPEEKADLDAVLGLCDGFILQGGLSGDFYELYIARYALEKDLPIMGICAGFNMLARAAGADIASYRDLGLPQERHNVYSPDYRHTIDVVRGSALHRIFGTDTLSVNSLHTQFVPMSLLERQPSRITVNATITDTLESGEPCVTVECFTVRDAKFAFGFKWHPELMDSGHKAKLFRRFLEACEKAKTAR